MYGFHPGRPFFCAQYGAVHPCHHPRKADCFRFSVCIACFHLNTPHFLMFQDMPSGAWTIRYFQNVSDCCNYFRSFPLSGQNLVHITAVNKQPGFFSNGFFKPFLFFAEPQKFGLYAQTEVCKFATIHKKVPPCVLFVDRYVLGY